MGSEVGVRYPCIVSADLKWRLVRRRARGDLRELVIGRRARGRVALYRYVAELDTVFVLAIRGQKEGYTRT
jgi:hypothetical protein